MFLNHQGPGVKKHSSRKENESCPVFFFQETILCDVNEQNDKNLLKNNCYEYRYIFFMTTLAHGIFMIETLYTEKKFYAISWCKIYLLKNNCCSFILLWSVLYGIKWHVFAIGHLYSYIFYVFKFDRASSITGVKCCLFLGISVIDFIYYFSVS